MSDIGGYTLHEKQAQPSRLFLKIMTVGAILVLASFCTNAGSSAEPGSEIAALTENGRKAIPPKQKIKQGPRVLTFECLLIGEKRPAHCFPPDKRQKVEALPDGCRLIPCAENPRGVAEVVECPLGKEPPLGTTYKVCSP